MRRMRSFPISADDSFDVDIDANHFLEQKVWSFSCNLFRNLVSILIVENPTSHMYEVVARVYKFV